jgi:hypothetical protein
LLGRKDEWYDGVFLKERDILKRVFFHMPLSYQELEKVACCPDIGIHRVFIDVDMVSHLKEKPGLKRIPGGVFLYNVPIEKAKMISYVIEGISQALAIGEERIDFRRQEAFKGFH